MEPVCGQRVLVSFLDMSRSHPPWLAEVEVELIGPGASWMVWEVYTGGGEHIFMQTRGSLSQSTHHRDRPSRPFPNRNKMKKQLDDDST